MKNGKQPICRQCSNEETLLALAVVDELTSHTPVHTTGRIPQVIEPQPGPIFAEAVGKDTIGGGSATQIEQGLSNCFDAAESLHRQLLSCRISYRHSNCPVVILVVKLDGIDEVCFSLESRVGDGQGPARPEFIGKSRLGNMVARIIAGAQPLVIDLSCHAAGENRWAALRRDLIRSSVLINIDRKFVIFQLLSTIGCGAN